MSEAQKTAPSAQVTEQVVEGGLLDQIVEQGRLARDPASRERGKNLVKEFVQQVLEGAMTVSKDAEAMINARIAQIDHLVSLQLNEVMHNPVFQKLEGSWRGLKFLLDHSETSDKLKIKVLNVSKKELLRDLQRAPEFDQSALFKKVYEEEFGVFGGAPDAAPKTSSCWKKWPRWHRPRTRPSSPPPRRK
jgi:type VI secretion system protein ImpC